MRSALTGALMRQMRERSGLSQGAVAERMNVGRSSVSKREHGVNTVTVEQFIAFCDVNGCSAARMVVLLEKQYLRKKERSK